MVVCHSETYLKVLGLQGLLQQSHSILTRGHQRLQCMQDEQVRRCCLQLICSQTLLLVYQGKVNKALEGDNSTFFRSRQKYISLYLKQVLGRANDGKEVLPQGNLGFSGTRDNHIQVMGKLL